MKNPISTYLSSFLKKQNLYGKQIACAVSTGIDSMVLFDALLQLKNRFDLKLICLHAHHGWRQESDIELSFLHDFCKKVGVELVFKYLSLNKDASNSEGVARDARYSFFQEVYLEKKLHGIFLGHHRDDLAETVFKRLFEGSNFIHLNAMKPCSIKDEMVLFRPLIYFSKKDIQLYAKCLNIPYFEDITNFDRRYQRTQIRHELIPYIEEKMGKSIHSALIHLQEQASDFEDYIDAFFQKNVNCGSFLNTHALFVLKGEYHLYIVKNIVLYFVKMCHLSLSRDMVKHMAEALLHGESPKTFITKTAEFFVSKNVFVICFRQKIALEMSIALFDFEKTALPNWFRKKFPSVFEKNQILLTHSDRFNNGFNF